MELESQLKWLLSIAWMLPLLGFIIEVFGGHFWSRVSKTAAYIAVGCIGTGFVCSLIALLRWTGGDFSGEHWPEPFSGEFYTLATFGDLRLSIDYYIDSLTLIMFTMVTFIATCIHVFAIGYMSDELTEDHVDHQVHMSDGSHLHRPGRFYRFFSYMSLFCFSMLGLVLAGNIFQVFVFWELVGICSYLLIGFYVERHSASTAANKAFIVNRVGDFGFIIGLMIIWTSFGTFQFAGYEKGETGLFQMLRGENGQIVRDEATGDVVLNAADSDTQTTATVTFAGETGEEQTGEPEKSRTIPYALLVVAGIGIFCGCIGKSAQFPLQTWLPDAMEGPTPVSALVHSATMVAAGVYLAGRFFPMFTPEVLLVIAYIGCITLFIAATIAMVATDIKRVLAYSTISQLGYMMLAIGVGGWVAGLFHLITHAFFKSLMFLASGSVIIGCHHEQEMPKMGGLLKKMPITALTMLVGVIAISGLAIPGISIFGAKIAFSGYHSKDAIVATALAFTKNNPAHFLLFLVPLITAGITAFYMFRLWFFTFTGKPRDKEVYDHCHETPWIMTAPLIVLSLFAAFCAFDHSRSVEDTAIIEPHDVTTAHKDEDVDPNLMSVTGQVLLDNQPLAGANVSLQPTNTNNDEGTFAVSLHAPGAAVNVEHAEKEGEDHDSDHSSDHDEAGASHHTKDGLLYSIMIHSEPTGLADGMPSTGASAIAIPSHHDIHGVHADAGMYALIVAFLGALVAYLLYCRKVLDPEDIKRQAGRVHEFLVQKWQFDELYDVLFMKPVHVIASWCTWFDRCVLDAILHFFCRLAISISKVDRRFDEGIIDGLVDLVGNVTYSVGRSFRVVQTGRIRQYVLFIAVSVLLLFVLLFVFFPTAS